MIKRFLLSLLVAVVAHPVATIAISLLDRPAPLHLDREKLPWFFPLIGTWTDPSGVRHCRAAVLSQLEELQARFGEVSLAAPETHRSACEAAFARYMESGAWPDPLREENPRAFRRARFSSQDVLGGDRQVSVTYWLNDNSPNEASYTTRGADIREASLQSDFGPGRVLNAVFYSAPIAFAAGAIAFVILGSRRRFR